MGETLRRLGVKALFGLMGDGNMRFISHAADRLGLPYYGARHENCAVAMADGYARVSNRVGVCTVTQGPGVTNALSALNEARKAGTPLLFLAGETPGRMRGHHQQVDQAALFNALGAGIQKVRAAGTVAEDIARAYNRMMRAIRLAMLVALSGALPWLVQNAQAQETGSAYPVKPIHYIVPFAPSGTGDVCARFHAQGLQERLGQPVVVDNRPGASQAIGIETAVKSPADGYTVLQGTFSGLVLNPAFTEMAGKKLPFDPVRDLAPVSMVCTAPLYLAVNASVPARSIKELVQLARTRPGKLTYASNGVGSTMHLAVLLFATKMGIDLLHVPYKSSPQATTDLVSGVIDMFFSGSLLLPHAKAGKVRILASGSRQRTRATPDVPTMIEAGVPDFDVSSWFGLVVPAGVPQPIIRRLHRETEAVLRAGLQGTVTDIELGASTPEELADRIRSELQTWTKVMRDAGIKPDK